MDGIVLQFYLHRGKEHCRVDMALLRAPQEALLRVPVRALLSTVQKSSVRKDTFIFFLEVEVLGSTAYRPEEPPFGGVGMQIATASCITACCWRILLLSSRHQAFWSKGHYRSVLFKLSALAP